MKLSPSWSSYGKKPREKKGGGLKQHFLNQFRHEFSRLWIRRASKIKTAPHPLSPRRQNSAPGDLASIVWTFVCQSDVADILAGENDDPLIRYHKGHSRLPRRIGWNFQ